MQTDCIESSGLSVLGKALELAGLVYNSTNTVEDQIHPVLVSEGASGAFAAEGGIDSFLVLLFIADEVVAELQPAGLMELSVQTPADLILAVSFRRTMLLRA